MTVPSLQPGQTYRLKSRHFNAFSRAANAHDAGALGGGADVPRSVWDSSVRLIRNDSGEDCDAGDALDITDCVVTPDEAGVTNTNFLPWSPELIFIGTKAPAIVSGTSHNVQVAVLLGPLPSGATGPAVCSGIVTCRLNVAHAHHDRADLTDGTFRLNSSFYGPAEIVKLFDPPAGGADYSAVVRLGNFVAPVMNGTTLQEIPNVDSGNVQLSFFTGNSETIVAHNSRMGLGTIGNTKRVSVVFQRDVAQWQIQNSN